MKLRIKGNSIRFRLTKSEVDYFEKERYLEEKTEFGNTVFSYVIANTKQGNELSAEFIDNKITLLIPEQLSNDWIKTNRVGLESEMEIGGGKKLFLLIEKDFKCLDNTMEDQSDNYPNPLAGKVGS